MTLSDSIIKGRIKKHPLGELTPHITDDGSLSYKNSHYKESFHSSCGAQTEALEKFILPAQLNRFKDIKKIRVLDVCLGLGYNSACLMEEVLKMQININWKGLEIDKRPLRHALKNPCFRQNWSPKVLEILESINYSDKWESNEGKGNVLWGDARTKISLIPKSLNFDLIFHDAFSPNKCPQLWSEEFLYGLTQKLAPEGRILTYSSSAAIRASLKRAGLIIKSLKPINKKGKRWSIGTIGILPKDGNQFKDSCEFWQPLSEMEEAHLQTNAAIPFRDPEGNGSPKEILERREKEQQDSNLPSTSSWKKRWKNQASG